MEYQFKTNIMSLKNVIQYKHFLIDTHFPRLLDLHSSQHLTAYLYGKSWLLIRLWDGNIMTATCWAWWQPQIQQK